MVSLHSLHRGSRCAFASARLPSLFARQASAYHAIALPPLNHNDNPRGRTLSTSSARLARQIARKPSPSAPPPRLSPAALAPGVLRLGLSAAVQEKLAEVGAKSGPVALYDHLVSCVAESGSPSEFASLRSDPAQREAAAALQRIWEAARQQVEDEQRYHEQVLPAWEAEVSRLKAEFESAREARKAERVASTSASENEQGEAVQEELILPEKPAAPKPRPGGLFVHGEVGVGKSMLIDLFFDFCAVGAVGPRGARRVHFHSFMYGVHTELAQLRSQGQRDTGAVARRLRESGVRLLCLDEFQVTNISDAMVLETLLSELFRICGVIVLFTSNRPPEDLYKEGVNRHLAIPQFLDVLREAQVLTHEIKTQDYRSLRVAEALAAMEAAASDVPSERMSCKWLVGLPDTDAEKQIADAFKQLSGTEHGKETSVSISWGRQLRVPEHSNGVARFHFKDLCGGPLSSDDYLALSNHFHTFLVSGVPRFSVNDHNEARRFTNLVDVLYEQNTRLLCSAADQPEALLDAMESLLKVDIAALAKEAQGSAEGGWIEGQEPKAIEEQRIKWEGSNPWLRRNPFQKDMTLEEALKAAQSGEGLGGSADPRSRGNAVGIVGVLAPAIASLQESGFASRRAISRIRHMQTQEYLAVHRQRYLA